MEININDFVIFTDRVIAAKNQSGSMAPDIRNVAIWQAVMMHFNALYGLPESYRHGDSTPPVGWQITQDITDSMSQFLVRGYKLDIDRRGIANMPLDYVHKSALYFPYIDPDCENCGDNRDVPQYRPIVVLRNNEVSYRLTSQLVRPSLKFPVATFGDDIIQFYPTSMVFALMDYLRVPVTPVWGYTIVGGRAVYDPATSVNIEFPPQEMPMLAMRYLSLLGINLRENELQQFSQINTQQGV